ncbi:CLUMA_CG013719, isoform A [Clunio marinus]|uniref:CLUMA_CG013719, isoform A n=1 Tax=Clunio marinus TaxID=568069 RepID=A0A1J1IJT9_9DIPT|nr:CLUMA_CG013719, isoform A [Clunio marinus]
MDLEKQKGCLSRSTGSSSVRSSRKRKISTSCDDEYERQIKRVVSSQLITVSSVETSPDDSLSPQPPTSINSSHLSSSDDEKTSVPPSTSNIKTFTNTIGQLKVDGSSTASSSFAVNQRDSQTVNNSSIKKIVNSKSINNSNKSVPVEVAPSPAESISTTHTVSEVSDFDVITDLDRDEYDEDDYGNVYSPFEGTKLTDETALILASKGEKTPHTLKKRPTNVICYKTKIDDSVPCYVTPTSEQRLCPLPMLPWANREAVWTNMVRKDEKASLSRDANMFDNHPGLQPRMRAILLDWLIEVCEVYKLHRETYYLTVDYLDRYLTLKHNISKNQLQLIGITCLFIASKVEEIYPPKLQEFAYVTDSACTEEDILQQEILILQSLNWSITPVTIIGWVSIYMQLNDTTGKTDAVGMDPKSLLILNSSKWSQSFIYPQFSGLNYARTAQLVDVCSLDVGIGNFPYSIIAAAAISHVIDKNVATRVSGLDWASIAPCAKWMEPYYQVLEEDEHFNPIKLQETNDQVEMTYGVSHVCPNLMQDPSPLIQTHSTSLDIFDRGVERRDHLEANETVIKQEASPAPTSAQPCPPGILTPPASNRKSIDLNNPH